MSRWRGGAHVAGVAHRVGALGGVAPTLGQPGRVARNVVGDPVGEPIDQRSVGIVYDDSERLSPLRNPGPLERRRDVLAITRVLVRDPAVPVER